EGCHPFPLHAHERFVARGCAGPPVARRVLFEPTSQSHAQRVCGGCVELDQAGHCSTPPALIALASSPGVSVTNSSRSGSARRASLGGTRTSRSTPISAYAVAVAASIVWRPGGETVISSGPSRSGRSV